jgi:hypothetical protein
MSNIPPNPEGDPSFSPNPDFSLNLNAAAAAYEVDVRMNGLVDDLLETEVSLKETLFGDTSRGMTKKEFVEGFRLWQNVLRAQESKLGIHSDED